MIQTSGSHSHTSGSHSLGSQDNTEMRSEITLGTAVLMTTGLQWLNSQCCLLNFNFCTLKAGDVLKDLSLSTPNAGFSQTASISDFKQLQPASDSSLRNLQEANVSVITHAINRYITPPASRTLLGVSLVAAFPFCSLDWILDPIKMRRRFQLI